jgi:SAM-dependent methyltransferase
MTFSEEWDERYKANTNMSIWPWSDVISLIMRYSHKERNGLKILELGCGAGANIPFFISLGMDYYAIEGSNHIVKKLHDSFPNLKDHIKVGDFTLDIPFDTNFDFILDRSSMTHNSTKDIMHSLNMISSKLNPNGKYFGIDWFSSKHSDKNFGEKQQDGYTYSNFKDGQFVGVGKVHFSDKEHLEKLF